MKYRHVLFIFILIFGIVLRIYTFSEISSIDHFTWIGGDPAHYYEVASNIYQGNGPVIDFIFQFWKQVDFGQNDALFEPLFPYILAYFFYIFGQSLFTAKLVVFLFSIASIVLIYFIGKNIYNENAGLIASFLLAIQPKHIEYSVSILKDNVYIFLFLLAFFLMLLSFKENGLWHWILFGIFIALSFLARYFSIILILTFIVLLIIYRKKVNWKYVGISLLAFLLVLLPWAIYTYNEFGSPFFSITRYYPYSASSWEGMSYEESAPTLERYLEENSIKDIIITRLKLIPLTLYHLPIWMTPLVFLLFITVFLLKDSYVMALKLYFLILILFYMVQFAAPGQFIERAYFALIYTSLVPIAFIISKTPDFIEGLKIKINKKVIASLIIGIILISCLALLQWKLNGIKSYNMQERQEDLERLGVWIKSNTKESDVIMTLFPADVHFYAERRTVMDPYNFALGLRISNIEDYKNRNKEEALRYNVTYVLIHTKNIEQAKEGYIPFSLNLKYSDEEAELYLYKIRRFV